MSKTREKRSTRRTAPQIAFSKSNYMLFCVSAVVLVLGYWALSQEPVDGFLTLTLAPILLVIGYCVLIPAAIMFSDKDGKPETK